jgi:hypothetical protein
MYLSFIKNPAKNGRFSVLGQKQSFVSIYFINFQIVNLV